MKNKIPLLLIAMSAIFTAQGQTKTDQWIKKMVFDDYFTTIQHTDSLEKKFKRFQRIIQDQEYMHHNLENAFFEELLAIYSKIDSLGKRIKALEDRPTLMFHEPSLILPSYPTIIGKDALWLNLQNTLYSVPQPTTIYSLGLSSGGAPPTLDGPAFAPIGSGYWIPADTIEYKFTDTIMGVTRKPVTKLKKKK